MSTACFMRPSTAKPKLIIGTIFISQYIQIYQILLGAYPYSWNKLAEKPSLPKNDLAGTSHGG